jgi:hypothetical protein
MLSSDVLGMTAAEKILARDEDGQQFNSRSVFGSSTELRRLG